MFVVLLSTAGSIPTFVSGRAGVSGSGSEILRLIQVLRVVRLVPKSKGLRRMFQTLVAAIPAFANVGSVVLLIYFIFAARARCRRAHLPARD